MLKRQILQHTRHTYIHNYSYRRIEIYTNAEGEEIYDHLYQTSTKPSAPSMFLESGPKIKTLYHLQYSYQLLCKNRRFKQQKEQQLQFSN